MMATLLAYGVPGLAAADVQIQTSFFPYYEFTKNVAGDAATVTQFLPLGSGPHDWEPSIRQVQVLGDADIIVYNGLGVDMFIDRLVESGDLSDAYIIEAGAGLTLITTGGLSGAIESVLEEYEHGHYTTASAIEAIHDAIDDYDIQNILLNYRAGDLSTAEAMSAISGVLHGAEDHVHHDHDDHADDHTNGHDDHADDADTANEIRKVLEEIEEGHITNEMGLEEIESTLGEHSDEHGHDDHGHDHDHGIYDPHVWLDPVLAQHQVETIRDGLVTVDPDNTAIYEENAASYIAELEDLHDQYVTSLQNCRQDTIVTFHSAFGYLVDRYNIKTTALTGLTGLDSASATDVVRIVEFIRESGVGYILTEFGVDPRHFDVIAEETGVEVLTLSPLEGISQEDFDSGASYISKMMENLDALKISLECN